MNHYTIRELQASDAKVWLHLWQAYLSFYQTSLPAEVSHKTLERLLSHDPNIGCLVACDSENIPVAMANYIIHFSTWAMQPECYLQDLYVNPEHRRSGIAQLLLEQLTRLSQEHECSKLYWITKPDNLTAQALYNKMAKSQPWLLYTLNNE